MDHGIRKTPLPPAPVRLNFTSRFRGEHRSGACHDFGKGCSSGRVTDLGNGTRSQIWVYSGIATCPAEDSATCRCWTALRPDRRPSSTTSGPHDLPGDSPSTSDCPTTTALASASAADACDASAVGDAITVRQLRRRRETNLYSLHGFLKRCSIVGKWTQRPAV